MSHQNQSEQPIFQVSDKLYQQLVDFQENLEKTSQEQQSESKKTEKSNSNSASSDVPNIAQDGS